MNDAMSSICNNQASSSK